jgi:two-component system sensor histidine kinase UhpB
MSLRQRLLLHVALVLGFSLLAGAAISYWNAAGKIRTELHAAYVVGEQVLKDATQELQQSAAPYQQLPSVIDRFSGGRHLRVSLIDDRGARVAESRLEMPREPAPDWFYSLLGGPPETFRIAVPSNVHGYSALLMEADPRNEVQEVWEDLGGTLLNVSILAGLVSALIYWTLGRELKPLGHLSVALSRVAQRDFSMRLVEEGPQDLRAVTKGFNHMADQLEQAEAANTLLEEQLSNVQDEERTELARDLHDEIGPLLFSVGLDAAAVQKALGENADRDVTERLESIREAVALSQKRVLQILGRLRSGTVEDLGLEAAVNRLMEFWTSRRPSLRVDAVVPEDGVGPDLDPVVYRIVQESMSNAVRHGDTGVIEIVVRRDADETVFVSVCDDGGGLRTSRAGHGLTGMRERVTSRGGVFTIGNRPDGKGTLVEVRFPKPLRLVMSEFEVGSPIS